MTPSGRGSLVCLIDRSAHNDQMRFFQAQRRKRVHIPTKWFDFREGTARRVGGSTSTPPFVLSTNMGLTIHIYFQESQPRTWERPGYPVDFANMQLLGGRKTRHLSRCSRVMHWSTGKRSCHAICDEHSVLYGHVNLLIIFMPHACTRVDHSSCLGESRKGTSSCSASVANPTSTTCEHILS